MLAAVDDEVAASPGPERLFLMRKASQHRRLENAGAVEALLVDAGFVSVDFGSSTFAEQLRLVRGARHVVGPSGSALLNCVFGRRGLRIGVLTPPYLRDIGWLSKVSGVHGLELTAIVGTVVNEHERYRWMSSYTIDLDDLSDYLDASRDEAGATTPLVAE
jgi:capsular polysaccharide biosynthesis protein